MTPRQVREASELIGWTPIRVQAQPQASGVHWADLGPVAFEEPGFRLTVEARMAAGDCPTAVTGLAALEALAACAPHMAPSGFIFHMSRVGSTLLCNLLRCLEGTLVMAEPGPVNQLLQSPFRHRARADWVRWFKGLIAALGQPRRPGQHRFFVKFSSHNVLQLNLIRQVYPDVPWLFLYRDPLEVMVSNLERPPGWMRVQADPPAGRNLFGIPPERLAGLSPEAFLAEALQAFCRSALAAAGPGGAFVNYDQLRPEAFPAIAAHLGAGAAAAQVPEARLSAVFASDAKAGPQVAFTADRDAKVARAGPQVRSLCADYLSQPYGALEAVRLPI